MVKAIEKQDWLENAGEAVATSVNNAFEAGGEAGQEVKNFLHGTWLGHPLHPVITDVPIGAWTTAFVFDLIETVSGRKDLAAGADAAIAVGLVSAVGAAATGVTDWASTTGRPRRLGLVHGLLNATGATLYATSLLLRRKKKSRGLGIGVSMLGFAVAGTAAYLGGHLVYGEQVGVDHTAGRELPTDFVPAMRESDLQENKLTRADAGGTPVLLVKRNGQIHAIHEVCSHLGGPLAEGKLEGDAVQCPWHGSRFSIEDGSVVDGPATEPQPCFEVQVRDGQIFIRSNE